jgi:DNA-binding transcriptional LysR family regulator
LKTCIRFIENGLDLECCQLKELAAVRSGAGTSVVFRALVQDDLDHGRLIALHQGKRDGLGYYITTLGGAPSAKVKAFQS